MKKIILLILFSFSFINSFALTYGGCDYSTVSRMKSIVKNINISYDYTIVNGEPSFSVTINNLTSDVFVYDTLNRKEYFYSDTNNGEITIYNYTDSGSYKFFSNNSECYGLSLGTKYYNFPKYNKYYTHELCSDIPDYSLCQKWVYVNYSPEDFEQKVLEYKNQEDKSEQSKITVEYKKTFVDIIVEVYINYYYYFLGALILFCSIIIIIHNRKNRFKL